MTTQIEPIETDQLKDFSLWLESLGSYIADCRKKADLTQQQFAERLRISQSVIAKIENGQNMTCLTLWKISQALTHYLEIEFKDRGLVSKMVHTSVGQGGLSSSSGICLIGTTSTFNNIKYG